MEKYLKSIDKSMKGIHEELKKMNRQGFTNVTNNIDVKKDDVDKIASDIAHQIDASVKSNISHRY